MFKVFLNEVEIKDLEKIDKLMDNQEIITVVNIDKTNNTIYLSTFC